MSVPETARQMHRTIGGKGYSDSYEVVGVREREIPLYCRKLSW